MARNRSGFKDLGVVIRGIGSAAQEAQKKAVFNAALHMKDVIQAERSKDLKGKDHFSGMLNKKTRSGKFVGIRPETHKLTVSFNVKGEMSPTALLLAKGPWGLLENGAARHDINAKGEAIAGRSRKAARARTQRNLNIAFGASGAFAGTKPLGNKAKGFGPFFRVANHPGTRPKKTFSRAVKMATPKSTQIATSLIQSKVIHFIRVNNKQTIYLNGEMGSMRELVG